MLLGDTHAGLSSPMVLDEARGIRAPKWLWLAVRETLLVGWPEQSFKRDVSGAKVVPDADSAFEYAKTTWMAEPYRVDLAVYEGCGLPELHQSTSPTTGEAKVLSTSTRTTPEKSGSRRREVGCQRRRTRTTRSKFL